MGEVLTCLGVYCVNGQGEGFDRDELETRKGFGKLGRKGIQQSRCGNEELTLKKLDGGLNEICV